MMIFSVQWTIDAIQFASAENSFGKQQENGPKINIIPLEQVNSIASANNANYTFTELSPNKITTYPSWVLDINSIHDHSVPLYTNGMSKKKE